MSKTIVPAVPKALTVHRCTASCLRVNKDIYFHKLCQMAQKQVNFEKINILYQLVSSVEQKMNVTVCQVRGFPFQFCGIAIFANFDIFSTLKSVLRSF